MELKDLKVGDKVWLHSTVRYKNSGQGTITKIGTKWITVSDGTWEFRFDKITGRGDYSEGTPPYELYKNKEDHDKYVLARQDFRILRDQIDRIVCPPSEITRKVAAILGIDIDKHKEQAKL